MDYNSDFKAFFSQAKMLPFFNRALTMIPIALATMLATTPSLVAADFHLATWSELFGPGDGQPSFFSAAVKNYACKDIENAKVAQSADGIHDPLPATGYPWWTVEFSANVCGTDLDFLQKGNGDFLVYRTSSPGGFVGTCTKGSQSILNCQDLISSLQAIDAYTCQASVC